MADYLDPLRTPKTQPDYLDPLGTNASAPPSPNTNPIAENVEFAFGNEFTKGFRRGLLGLAGTSTAAVGQVAEAVGAKETATNLFNEAQRLVDFDQGLRPKVETWDDVKDPASFARYGLSKAGEAAPSTLLSLAAAGVGGAAGLGLRAAGVRALSPNVASYAAGAGSMMAPEMGESALTMQADPQALANTTPMERLAISGGKGAVNAALEFLPERLAIGRAFTRPVGAAGLGGLARSTALGAGESALGEAATEAAQEVSGQMAHGLANPQRDTSQDLLALREAALSGAFGGAPMGAVAGGVQGIRANLKGGVERAKPLVDKGVSKLPSVADVATFIRRSAQEPEFFGEQAQKAFEAGKTELKRDWKYIGELAAVATDKAEDIIAEANNTVRDAIIKYDALDQPGGTANREFLYNLQNDVGSLTKELYFTLKDFTADPSNKHAQEQVGLFAKGLVSEKLPKAGQRTMDWLTRTTEGFKRGVDQKAKASVEWTDAKDATRDTLIHIDDESYNKFRGLKLAEQRAVIGLLVAAREAPKRVTPEARQAFEEVMGKTVEQVQADVDAEQQVSAAEVEKEYRRQMVKKITAARSDMAALQNSTLANASPELREQAKARIAEKYGLKLNEIEEGVGTKRTEAVFDSDEQVMDALNELDTQQEGAPSEIEPPLDAEISQEVLGNSIQNLHYFRKDEANEDKTAPRAHLWVTLRPDPNDPEAPTARQILESFTAEDSVYTGGARRKFTDAEIAQFTNEDGSVRLPIRPMSLAAEMQRNPSTKDALDPIRKGQTGGSLSRKGDLLMTGLSTLTNTGLKWTDSTGVDHKLQVEPEYEDVPIEVGPKGQTVLKTAPGAVARTERRLPRNILIGAPPSRKRAQDRHAAEAKAQTVDTYLNEKPAWTPRSAEALTAERKLIEYLRTQFDLLDSFRFKDVVNQLAERMVAADAYTKKAFGRWRKLRTEKALAYIEAAEQRAKDNDEELTAAQQKEINNDAWQRGTEEAFAEIGGTNLRATVNDGLKTIFEDVQDRVLDRIEAGFKVIAEVDGLIRYLETNGEAVSPEVNALFRENNIRMFTPELLKDPALEYDDGGTPQERYINRLEWLKQRAAENERGGLYAQAEQADEQGSRLDETSKEVLGIGNTVWDQGSFAIPTEPVTAKKKDSILASFATYVKRLKDLGKYRIQSPSKLKYQFGYFQTEQDARNWLAELPEEGVKGLRIKVDGDKHLYTYDEAQAKWPWKEFDENAQGWEKSFRKEQRKAHILNPESGNFLTVGHISFDKMTPQIATAHLKELARLVHDAKNAKIVDATPMYTWTPPQPVRKASETDEEYTARVRATVKPASQPLTYNQLEKLIRTKEVPDRNAKVPLAKPEVSPQGQLDLQDDVLKEENRVNTTPPPIKSEIAVDFPDVGESKQRELDLFETPEVPTQKPERVSRTVIRAGLSGETTMHPMYLWKRSVVRARREQAQASTPAQTEEPLPRAVSETVIDDFGTEVRRDYRGKVTYAAGKDVVQRKSREETDATPAPGDEDLLKFSRVLNKKLPPAVGRTEEPNRVTGDIWDQDGFKIVTTNLGGVHGRGLAKQAKDKGLIDWKHREFGSSPFDKKVITLAVKGKAPETRTEGKGAWSEQVTGGNIDLLRSELRKLVIYARNHPNEKFYLPYAGLGFGEGDPKVITPMLEWVAREPNIFLISRGDEVQERYPESLKPGVRRDATTREKPEAPKPVQPTPAFTKREQAPKVNKRAEKGALEKLRNFEETVRLRFLRLIKRTGGITAAEASDIIGEKRLMAANSKYPAMFSKTGRNLDDIATTLMEAGYITEAQVSDFDLVRDMIRTALEKDPVMTMQERDEHAELLRDTQEDEVGYTPAMIAAEEAPKVNSVVKAVREEAKLKEKLGGMLQALKTAFAAGMQETRELAQKLGGVDKITDDNGGRAIKEKIEPLITAFVEEAQKIKPTTEEEVTTVVKFLEELQRMAEMFDRISEAVEAGEITEEELLAGKMPAAKSVQTKQPALTAPKVEATESEYSGPAMQRRLERDTQLKKEADEFAAGDTYVVENVDAHGGKFRNLTPEQVAARAGQMAELRREPSNKHDPNAIKVLHNGVHQTYVSREYTKGMVENRAKGYTYAAKFDSTGKYLIIKRTAPKQGEPTDEFGYTPAMVAAEEAQNDPSRTAAKKADEQPAEPVTTRTVMGENIASPYKGRNTSPLAAALTNVTFGKYQVERVPGLKAPDDPMHKKSAEAWYKANRTGNQRKDMLLMQRVIEAKLRQYPELVKQIDERGGEAWIKASNHTVNGNVRWEGKGMESNFLRVLRDAYLAVKDFPTVEQGNEIWRRFDSGYTRDEAEGFVRREPAEPAPTKAEAPATDELTTLNTPHDTPKHHFVPMKYAAGPGQLRPELNKLYPKGATMLRLINDGHRTGTTRTPQAGMRKGDTFQLAFSPKRYEVTGFERVDLDTPEGQERWSQREGWSVEGVRAAGHGNQVKTGSIQMTFAPVGEKPIIKEQRKSKKKQAPELVGPPEEQAGPPLPPFVGPPTARDLGVFKKEQEEQQEIPKTVPDKLQKLIKKMFGVEVAIRYAPEKLESRNPDARAWYIGRRQLNSYKANMARLREVREERRKALSGKDKDIARANELLEEEKELLQHTQVLGVIYLSTKLSEAEQLGSTYHEAVHAMFDILLTPEERAVLGAAFSQGLVRNKLRQIFKDDPEVLNHMTEPEEAAAYAFQVWAVDPSKLPLGAKATGVFNKLKAFLRKLFGILTPEEKALIIFNDMLSGRRAETKLSPLQKVLDKDMTLKQRSIKTARDMADLVRKGWGLVAQPSYQRLMATNNPALQKIAQLGATQTGEDRQLGMVQRWFQQNTEKLNRLDKLLKSYKPEVVKEAMEARLLRKKPTSPEAKEAYKAMDTFFDEMHEYYTKAQREGGEEEENLLGKYANYFPIMWDSEKVMKNRDEFMKMINKPEYASYIEELRMTPSELWEHISGYLIRGEKFTGVMNVNTNEPINDFSSKRSLSFLSPEDMRPFLQDDPIHVMLHYTRHMVRHAEYTRAFGAASSRLVKLKTEAKEKYGATNTQLEWADDYVDGLLGNREVGMSRDVKDVYGAMTVYQNFRLLPFSLFSSLVDPLGIAVRSNRLADASEAFGYALKNLFRDFGKRSDESKDFWERLAEDWGIIEDSQVLANIHHMYESVELRGFSKRMNEALFKYNMLEGWVRSTKIMATKAAQRFIYRAAKNQLGKDSKRYLEELGLTESDVVADDNGNIALTKQQLMAQGVSEAQATDIEKRLREATAKFVNQSVLNPTAADLPGWGSNPYFAPIFHLKQFMFTFQNVIMSRIAHEMEQGNYKPLWISSIYIAGMIAADMMRGYISNFGEEPPWQKDWGAADYLVNGVERSGLLGSGALLTGMKDDMMHGGTGYESLAGPSIEQLRKGLSASQAGETAWWNFTVKAMPLNPIYDQWLLSRGGGNAA